MPPTQLSGRPIAITGASSGIGRATAIACARAGMPVAIAARRMERLRDIAAEIEAGGGEALPIECDVTRPEDCEALVERTVHAFGSLHAVFANAGYGAEAPTLDMSDTDFRDMLETNFHGSLNLVRPAARHMLEAGSGHMLICSSCLSKIAIPYYAAYTISKAAQDHLARALRLELAPTGVHVSSVHPVGTKTEFFEKAADRSRRAKLMDLSSERFMQPPERVARAVVSCLRRPRPEVWTFHPARIAFALSGLSPRLTDAILARMLKRRLARNEARDQGSRRPQR